MNEPIGTADIDEDTEVANAGDAASLDVAFLQLLEQALLLRGALFLNGGPLG